MPAPTEAPPRCACGAPMVETATPGFYECEHCDSACHARCDDAGCTAEHFTCASCKGLDRGTAKKRDRNWHP